MYSVGTLMRVIWRSSKRATVFVVGVALVIVGLIMFVTPGPGIVLVVAGLAVLATEFAWAEHLLDKAKEQAAKAGQSAQRLPGVARATSAAARLVPRRWRQVTSVTVSTDTVTTPGGQVIERTTVTASETMVVASEVVAAEVATDDVVEAGSTESDVVDVDTDDPEVMSSVGKGSGVDDHTVDATTPAFPGGDAARAGEPAATRPRRAG